MVGVGLDEGQEQGRTQVGGEEDGSWGTFTVQREGSWLGGDLDEETPFRGSNLCVRQQWRNYKHILTGGGHEWLSTPPLECSLWAQVPPQDMYLGGIR
eukprot:759367-Hanusia_phi.AAC.1